jgi:hypothetical protein
MDILTEYSRCSVCRFEKPEYGHFLLSSMSEYKNFGADCTVPVVIVDIYSHIV